jgi:four helix bundle protein
MCFQSRCYALERLSELMYRESRNAESDLDFIHKLAIAQKECDETCYWLELLFLTDYLNENEYTSINSDAIELLKIIKSIIITVKKRIKK